MAADDSAAPVVQYRSRESETAEVLNQVRKTMTVSPPTRDASEMFYRFAASNVWNPRLDSDVLEKEHQRLAFPETRRRFRLALGYVIATALAWLIFFAVHQATNWSAFVGGCAALVTCALITLAFTFSRIYSRLVFVTSVVLIVVLCTMCLLTFATDAAPLSPSAQFTIACEILVLMYTAIPLKLYACFLIGVLFSVAFETFSCLPARDDATDAELVQYVIGRALLQVCVHLLGAHLFYLSHVRERKTFLKVGQSIVTRRDLEREKNVKKNMIDSLMPEQVAKEVMEARGGDRQDDDSGPGTPRPSASGPSMAGASAKLTFRNFHMKEMDKVSILFADIVGFTKMSSNKTAEELVTKLNDLFGRFDVICSDSGCEKISTLGDCYYCVSGCPVARPDHAECCVEMGLRMVVAIEEFDRDHNEAVGMRVGVHTGTVLCGLVGTRRFKFDVWSHDVTIANLMESEGKPGLVHVSEPTYELVKHKYVCEQGSPIEGLFHNPHSPLPAYTPITSLRRASPPLPNWIFLLISNAGSSFRVISR